MQHNFDLITVANAIIASWESDTSADPENWSDANPALGQCAVSSLIIQDYFGGNIQRTMAQLPDGTEVSHWRNEIDEIYYDVTYLQFPKGTEIKARPVPAMSAEDAKNYAFQNAATKQRYEVLSARVTATLAKIFTRQTKVA